MSKLTCSSPIQRGPLKGKPATGSEAGYTRHRRASEPPCPECREAYLDVLKTRRVLYSARIERYQRSYHDRRMELQRQRREADPEREAAYRRSAYLKNPERHRARTRKWLQDNPDYGRLAAHIRRARAANVLHVPFTTDELDQRMAFWGNQCWMCGGPYESVDHVIPIALGGPNCLSNLRPACNSCNSSKGASHPSELLGGV